uniref:Family with sequence similarity 118 member A n=1 Tax=Oryctolagus cuniculus TaxID=9986 RepID=G1TK91_RABIT
TWVTGAQAPDRSQMLLDSRDAPPPPLFLSRKFLKSLIRKQPQELLLVIGTGVSAAVAPGIPALCSWRSCIEAVIEAAEQLEVLHPGDVAEFRRKVTKDQDLLVVAHDLIRKMSPVSCFFFCLFVLERSSICWFTASWPQWPELGRSEARSSLRVSHAGAGAQAVEFVSSALLVGQVLQWARGHVKYGVLHIHGLYTDPCGMVLDPSGYKDVTQDPEVMVRFLLVGAGGCWGLRWPPALRLWSEWFSRLRHYMLVLKEDEDHFFKHQADMLLHGIKVVSYGDCFAHFPGYVQDLATRISRCFSWSPMGCRAQALGPSSTALPGHSRELDWKRGNRDRIWRPDWD